MKKVEQQTGEILTRIRQIWESARTQAARSVNSAHVCANWLIGQQIVEAEQGGKERAGYGKQLIEIISGELSKEFGDGFSKQSLRRMRQFYQEYPLFMPIRSAVLSESNPGRGENRSAVLSDIEVETQKLQPMTPSRAEWRPGKWHPNLSWLHYLALIKVINPDARSFYEIETIKNNWSGRQLERQINSLLFERLAKSRDKKGVLKLAEKGHVVEHPIDLIKDPFVLEFLNLPESHRLVESKVEEALISKLQAFLMELGNGFADIGRQVRLTRESDHFYPDLIFYHVKLKCYVVIDLKVGKLSPADLGQMQMYVHFYDREIAGEGDNPTIGLILCTNKNDAMVKYVLDEKSQQIFTSRYQFHLPTEEQLRAEITRELQELQA